MLTKGAIGNLVNRYRAVLKKCHLMNVFGSLAVVGMLVMGGAGVAEAESVQTFTINSPNITLDKEFIWISKGDEKYCYVNGADEGKTVNEQDRYIVNINTPVNVTTTYTWGIDVSSDTQLYGQERLPFVTLQDNSQNKSGSLSLTISKTPRAALSDNHTAIQAQNGILEIDIPVSLKIITQEERTSNTTYNAVQALAEGNIVFTQPLDISANMKRENEYGLKFASIRALGIEWDRNAPSTVIGTSLSMHDAKFQTDKGNVNIYGLLADFSEQADFSATINFDSVTLGSDDSAHSSPSVQVSSSSGQAVFTGVKATEWGDIQVKNLTIAGVDVFGSTGSSFTGVEAGTDSSVVISGNAVIRNNTSSDRLYSLSAHGGGLEVKSGAHRMEGDMQAGIGELYKGDNSSGYTSNNFLHAPDAIVGWKVSDKVYENAGTIQASFTGENSWFYGFTSDGERVGEQYIQMDSNDQIHESSISLTFADNAFWSVVPSNAVTPDEGSYVSKLTNLSLDGTNVYVGTLPEAWNNNTQGNKLFTSSFKPLASTDKPTELRISNLSGSGKFYLRTDMEKDISDSVLVTDSLSGSYSLHVQASGVEPVETQTTSYLARAEQSVGADTGAFTLKGSKNINGQEVIDIGLYNYRMETSERNNGREWYLQRVENLDPVDPDDPTPPVNPNPPLSPTGETEAALSGLAGHYAMWYGQLTDLRKRLGEVRYGTQTGLWVRGFADKSRLDGLGGTSFTQNMFGGSIGYDTLASVSEESLWLVGMQLRSARAHQSVNGHWGGHGDLTSVGGGLYSTWAHADGWYVDAVGTMDWYNHKLRTSMLDGTRVHDDRSSYGLGASLEAGRKLDFAFSNEGRDYWFLEPQLQLSYFWVKGGDFHASNGMKIEQKDMDSLTGRAGLVLGKKFALDDWNGSRYVQPYVKAGVNHEFLGEQEARINGVRMTSDLDGTRVYYGAGVDWQATDNLRLYMQVEREHGEHFTREYNVSAGLKWKF